MRALSTHSRRRHLKALARRLTLRFVRLPSIDALIGTEAVLAVTGRDTRPTILVVDDNAEIRSFLRPALEDAGFSCLEAADGAEAVYRAEASRPDLIVLDIELGDPGMDGLDVCRRIRALDLDMPVIFLTVRTTVQDIESGLRVAGPGSDYVRKLEELRHLQLGGASSGDIEVAVKSPDTRELIARIRARLPSDVQLLGPDLRLDRKRSIAERLAGDQWAEVHLQPLEYQVLKTLVDADGAAVGIWELYEKVFAGGRARAREPDDDQIDSYKSSVWVCISNLRKKLAPAGEEHYVQSVHGIGYRFRKSDAG